VNEYKKRCNKNITSPDKVMTTGMNFVVMKSNYRELEKVMDFVMEYKFDFLRIIPTHNITRSINCLKSKGWGCIEKVMPQVLEKSRNGIILWNWLPRIKNLEKQQINDNKSNCAPTLGALCYWPWQFLIINPSGNVKPHCFCRKEVGNVHKNSLKEIWNNKLMQLYRQKLLNKDYRDLCDEKCISGVIPKEHLGLERGIFLKGEE
ncbi:unnamed protein product, partial [marine sediment metagenome]